MCVNIYICVYTYWYLWFYNTIHGTHMIDHIRILKNDTWIFYEIESGDSVVISLFAIMGIAKPLSREAWGTAAQNEHISAHPQKKQATSCSMIFCRKDWSSIIEAMFALAASRVSGVRGGNPNSSRQPPRICNLEVTLSRGHPHWMCCCAGICWWFDGGLLR